MPDQPENITIVSTGNCETLICIAIKILRLYKVAHIYVQCISILHGHCLLLISYNLVSFCCFLHHGILYFLSILPFRSAAIICSYCNVWRPGAIFSILESKIANAAIKLAKLNSNTEMRSMLSPFSFFSLTNY
jgi:hypothetical protein